MADDQRLRDPERLDPIRSGTCLNCGSPLTGTFCAACGQRDIPPYPTVRELASDAVSEFVGWDGRLFSTLRDLVRHPGLLTKEFLEGRRVRYISPLRLYLIASLVYFLVAAGAPNVRLGSAGAKPLGIRVETAGAASTTVVSRPQRVANAARAELESNEELSPAEKEEALKDIEKAPDWMHPLMRRVVEDPAGFKRGILQTMPRMLFVLLPIFAGIVALFYRRRKYPEHLYFALHLHAFVFLALAVAELLKYTRVAALAAVGSVFAVVVIPVYATLAFRRLYGGSLGWTLTKELAIGAIYSVVAAVGFTALAFWVSLGA